MKRPYSPGKRMLWRSGRRACVYCGEPLRQTQLTCDHATPTSRGGADNAGNWLPACALDNGLKGNLTFEEFAALVASDPDQLKKRARAALRRADRYWNGAEDAHLAKVARTLAGYGAVGVA